MACEKGLILPMSVEDDSLSLSQKPFTDLRAYWEEDVYLQTPKLTQHITYTRRCFPRNQIFARYLPSNAKTGVLCANSTEAHGEGSPRSDDVAYSPSYSKSPWPA